MGKETITLPVANNGGKAAAKTYCPDNIIIELQERMLELEHLIPIYKEAHGPSYRALAQALQNARFALDEVNLDKIVKAYDHLELFRS